MGVYVFMLGSRFVYRVLGLVRLSGVVYRDGIIEAHKQTRVFLFCLPLVRQMSFSFVVTLLELSRIF